jgi:hypothetical protein
MYLSKNPSLNKESNQPESEIVRREGKRESGSYVHILEVF